MKTTILILLLLASAYTANGQSVSLIATNFNAHQLRGNSPSFEAWLTNTLLGTVNANFQSLSSSLQSQNIYTERVSTAQQQTTSTSQYTAITKALDVSRSYILDISVIGKISGTSGGGVTSYVDRRYIWHNGSAWQSTSFTGYMVSAATTAGTVATGFSGDNWELKITPASTTQTDFRAFVLTVESD